MAFVDLTRNVLVLKVVLAGPPAVGKTTRLKQLGEIGTYADFGSKTLGSAQMASVSLPSEGSLRPVEIEVYEWHGPEKVDVRTKALFVGLDGVVYMADAREDRRVDTINQFGFLQDEAGKTRLMRLPGLLVLGRMDEGTLRLDHLEKKLRGPTWSERIEAPIDQKEPFFEAVKLFGEVMLARVL